MIKISNIEVMNFENAFRGMRNPMNSWDKSDSDFGICAEDEDCIWDAENFAFNIASTYFDHRDQYRTMNSNYHYRDEDDHLETHNKIKEKAKAIFEMSLKDSIEGGFGYAYIGAKDLELAQRLIKGGPVHSKFMRQIFVSMDIDAPLYWWKEMDTYHVGTTANSCSTMHKLAATPITRECFSFDEELRELGTWSVIGSNYHENFLNHSNYIIDVCEAYRKTYLETKDPRYWRALIQLLPESWNQKRTWTGSYENLRNIYTWRRNHKLTEWQSFCEECEKMPYGEELICYGIGDSNFIKEKITPDLIKLKPKNNTYDDIYPIDLPEDPDPIMVKSTFFSEKVL